MNKAHKSAVKHLIVCIVFCVISAIVFSPSNAVGQTIALDLSWLMIPAVSFFVIRMARKISLIYLPNCAGELTASVLNVISIFLFLYVLVLLLSKELLHNEQIPLIMESLIVYLIILIAGISALLASSQLS
ncbi:MAG: hypothetical protein GX631_05545, partial [Dehalococcoidales bacterium]|nr:hypothetical protein [Dehalococcoidales bacterium]